MSFHSTFGNVCRHRRRRHRRGLTCGSSNTFCSCRRHRHRPCGSTISGVRSTTFCGTDGLGGSDNPDAARGDGGRKLTARKRRGRTEHRPTSRSVGMSFEEITPGGRVTRPFVYFYTSAISAIWTCGTWTSEQTQTEGGHSKWGTRYWAIHEDHSRDIRIMSQLSEETPRHQSSTYLGMKVTGNGFCSHLLFRRSSNSQAANRSRRGDAAR